MAGVLLWVRGSWRRGRAAMLGVILLCGVAGAVVLTVAAGRDAPRAASTASPTRPIRRTSCSTSPAWMRPPVMQ